MPRPTKAIAIARIQRVRDQISGLKEIKQGSPEFDKWHRDTETALRNIFGDSSHHTDEFAKVRFTASMAIAGMPDSYFQDAYVRGLQRADAILQSMIEEIEEYWVDNPADVSDLVTLEADSFVLTNQVFLIHGRDHGTKETIARFLESLDLLQSYCMNSLTEAARLLKNSRITRRRVTP